MARRRRSGVLTHTITSYKKGKRTYRDLRMMQRDVQDRVADVRANGKRWTIRLLTAVTFFYLWPRIGSLLLTILVTAGLRAAAMCAWFFYRKLELHVGPREAGKAIEREKQIRRQWLRAAESIGFKRVPPLRDLKVTGKDATARVYAGKDGLPMAKLHASAESIANIVGCREVVVTPIVDRTGNYGAADLRFMWTDPLAKVVDPKAITAMPAGAAPIGLTDRGQVMAIPVLNERSESILTPMLIGGVSGSGKSTFNHAFLAGLIAQRIPTRLRIIDPAGGVEFAAYGDAWRDKEHTDYFRVLKYTDDSDGAEDIVKGAYADMQRRMRSITERRVRAHVPTLEEPLDIIVIDELLLLDALLKKGSPAAVLLGKYMSVCRKAGFGLMANTQQGHADTIGTIRERFRQRIAFATMSTEQTTTIMGSGQGSLLPPAHLIKKQPGTGYAFNAETNEIEKFRSVRFDDADVERIARGQLPKGWMHLGQPAPLVVDVTDTPAARGGLHVVRASA